jgi:hypothetical protein
MDFVDPFEKQSMGGGVSSGGVATPKECAGRRDDMWFSKPFAVAKAK